jgi:hypothetical protein
MEIQRAYNKTVKFDIEIRKGEEIINLREFIEAYFEMQVDSIILDHAMEYEEYTILTLIVSTN